MLHDCLFYIIFVLVLCIILHCNYITSVLCYVTDSIYI
jgi:hypothetical protein